MSQHGPWTITMGLGPRDLAAAGRLTEITRQVLGQDGAGVRVVFTPRPGVPGSARDVTAGWDG